MVLPIPIAGAYDLEGLAQHLHARGLYKELLDSIMCVDGRVAYDQLSPLHAARAAPAALGRFMPACVLVHGTRDKSVPHASSVLMDEALKALQVRWHALWVQRGALGAVCGSERGLSGCHALDVACVSC